MSEKEYFEQFAGDSRTVTGYFLYSDGSADYFTTDKDKFDYVFKLMQERCPSIKFEMRTHEVTENTWEVTG